jgi:hypothetical protein
MTLIFSKEKETKGTYRYLEAEVADRETAVGSPYVKKTEVGESPPGQLRVTIEAENMAKDEPNQDPCSGGNSEDSLGGGARRRRGEDQVPDGVLGAVARPMCER